MECVGGNNVDSHVFDSEDVALVQSDSEEALVPVECVVGNNFDRRVSLVNASYCDVAVVAEERMNCKSVAAVSAPCVQYYFHREDKVTSGAWTAFQYCSYSTPFHSPIAFPRMQGIAVF